MSIELDDLLAEQSIRQQITRYSRAIDRLDGELLASIWHQDGALVDPVAGIDDRGTDVAESLDQVYEPWAVHSHQTPSLVVRVNGDTAVSETHLNAVLRRHPDEDGRVVDDHVRGRCADSWIKTDGRWLLHRRQVSEGVRWHQEVSFVRPGKLTARDQTDPSYAAFSTLNHPAEEGENSLVADREIRRQLHNYCRAVDRFIPALWKQVWHDDGTFDYVNASERGRAAESSEHMTLDHYPWASHTHQSMSSTIAVNGDRAVSETYGSNILFGLIGPEGRPVDSHFRCRYLDQWAKRDGRWAIAHRRAISDLGWDQESIEGAVGVRARRDEVDPSHALFASVTDPRS